MSATSGGNKALDDYWDDDKRSAWGDDISDERKAELERQLQAWEQETDHGRLRGPFDDDSSLTGADVFWLVARTRAGTGDAQAVTDVMEELRLARDGLEDRGWEVGNASQLHLEGAALCDVHLESAILSGAHLEGADLFDAHLEGAVLDGAHLEDATLTGVFLDNAVLTEAHLQRASLLVSHLVGADMSQANLEHARLTHARLNHAHLNSARLEHADLDFTDMEGARLKEAHLAHAHLHEARLERADLTAAHLEHTHLNAAHLEHAVLRSAYLEGAMLRGAHLEGADLQGAHLEGADLQGAHLGWRVYGPDDEEAYQRAKPWADDLVFLEPAPGTEPTLRALPPADLSAAFFDTATNLTDVNLGTPGHGPGQGYLNVADVRWGGVNLALVKDWPRNMVLGDERKAWARQPPKRQVTVLFTAEEQKASWAKFEQAADEAQARVELFRTAVRANRQLAMALREQGMNEEADRFAYRAQVCQRQVYRLTHQRVRRAFSWLLDVLAGYGYRPERSLYAYLLAIIGFGIAYFALGHLVGPPLSPVGAFVYSMTSFHGRGFFPGGIGLDDPITVLAALEAFVGLVIEVSFIATFTQRFFGK